MEQYVVGGVETLNVRTAAAASVRCIQQYPTHHHHNHVMIHDQHDRLPHHRDQYDHQRAPHDEKAKMPKMSLFSTPSLPFMYILTRPFPLIVRRVSNSLAIAFKC